MRWIEVSVKAGQEAAEVIADVFLDYAYQGVAIERDDVDELLPDEAAPSARCLIARAYLPNDEQGVATRQLLESDLLRINQRCPVSIPQYRHINALNWDETWKTDVFPLHVGRHIRIYPPWLNDQGEPDDVMIVLEAGAAFGTGTHPSTQSMLEAIEDWLPVHPGASVLDLGCGSGILSLVAVRLGAASVLALDTDPVAIPVLDQNAAGNGLSDRITVQPGSLAQALQSAVRFDLVLVNISAHVIITMCQQNLGETLEPGGMGVFGGIRRDQADKVESALRGSGLRPLRRRLAGEYVVIEARCELNRSWPVDAQPDLSKVE
jgi:ribosomal protein L11 methyltransferase